MPIIVPTTYVLYNVKKTHLFWLPYVQFLKFQKTKFKKFNKKIKNLIHILE
jgi:hypothetical protein